MSGFIKHQLGVKQLVTNGNEGYRAKGKYDPNADVSYPFSTWLNSGIKGGLERRQMSIAIACQESDAAQDVV